MPGVLSPFMSFPPAAGGNTLVGTSYGYGYAPTITVPFPAGAQVGDIAVMLLVSTSGGSGPVPSGWSFGSVGFSGATSLYASKKLTSGDIATGSVDVSYSSGSYMLALYRGPTAVAVKAFLATGYNTPSPMVATGFTKAAGSKIIASIIGSPTAMYSLSPGAPLTSRAGNTAVNLSDINPASGYTNGSDFSYSYSDSNTPTILGAIWELS